ncbi:recombinase family protein [Pararhizobium sp. IMCC21322]|uniref:recombinase family protein n=1 Tax=Pararhizobium sp. IMCC21322 TaxID=3067903 RepID=UPI002740451B|nr:recombinase family protein [Pararhizobium sp. IMCC21322]
MRSYAILFETVVQSPNAQRDALKAASCEKVVIEKVSGASLKWPKLKKLLCSLDAGDLLTIWRLDEVGRSLLRPLGVAAVFKARNVGLQSLNETIDPTVDMPLLGDATGALPPCQVVLFNNTHLAACGIYSFSAHFHFRSSHDPSQIWFTGLQCFLANPYERSQSGIELF